MTRTVVALAALVGLVSEATAVNTWTVDVTYSNQETQMISQLGDFATVMIWANFDESFYAFAAGYFSVLTDDANGSWSDFDCDLKAPGTKAGTADGGDVNDIITGQLHFPPADIFADTSNPILVWHGTFTTDDLSLHNVSLVTVTERVTLYINSDGVNENFYDGLGEGDAIIEVGLPGPAGAALFGLGALAASRRRR
jgi:MYXO-CTERM domain-containing protein